MGHIGVGPAHFHGGPRIPFWREPLTRVSVRPTVTCQMGQLDRYQSWVAARLLFPNGFIATSPPPPVFLLFPLTRRRCRLLITNHHCPALPSHSLCAASRRRSRSPMGCFLGCFGGAKERRRRRKRSPSQSPNGRARVTESTRSVICFVSPVARSSSSVGGSDHLIESACDVGSGCAAGYTEEG
jgi:hypothetical protein